MINEVENLKQYFLSLNVVCPNPHEWMALADIIGSNQSGHRVVPLILAGWAYSSDHQKNSRVIEQIDYAATQGDIIFRKFSEFFYSIPDEGWYR